MQANTEKLQSGIEVYTHKMLELADKYINSLEDPQTIQGNNKGTFVGMLKYIYNNYFKYNSLDYADIQNIDNVWDIYTTLCYKYNKRPTILNFSILTGINMDTINCWKNKYTRQYKYYTLDGAEIKNLPAWKAAHRGEEYKQEPSANHAETVKKWLRECEAALYDGATEQNSIGCIFALKANYGYTETAPVPTINQNAQIAADAELPKLGAVKTLDVVE